jgi:hypothetical protein
MLSYDLKRLVAVRLTIALGSVPHGGYGCRSL